MTNRVGRLSQIWASDGEVADPDLNTEHPIFQEGKYLKGWKVEKEPHQWQNYLYQITDLKKQIVASEQFVEWDAEIAYAPQAVVRHEELLYLNVSDVDVTGEKPGDDKCWEPLLGSDAESINTVTSDLNRWLKEHLAADNPHDDNIHDIGGYEKEEIDAFLGDPEDPKTIVYHEAQTGAVHSETPEQVGTLPVSGGLFEGDVVFRGGITVGEATLRQDGPDAALHLGKSGLYATSAGVVLANENKSEVVTEANFNDREARINNLFALPPPVGEFDFSAGSFSRKSLGRYSLNYDASLQKIDAVKGWVIADGVTISGLHKELRCTHVCEYFIEDEKRITIMDSANLSSQSLKQFAIYFNSKMTHLLRLTSYPVLTTYQKATIYRG